MKNQPFLTNRSIMNAFNQVQNSISAQRLVRFKKDLLKLDFDEFFKEKEGELSLWHILIYEPMDISFIKAVFEWATFLGKSVPIDIPVKKESYQKGRSAYLIATAFGMKDKMNYLASQGANTLFSFKKGQKTQDALIIAETFFGPNSDSPDSRILKLVERHQIAQQRKHLSDAIPQAHLQNKRLQPKL